MPGLEGVVEPPTERAGGRELLTEVLLSRPPIEGVLEDAWVAAASPAAAAAAMAAEAEGLGWLRSMAKLRRPVAVPDFTAPILRERTSASSTNLFQVLAAEAVTAMRT